MVELINYFNSIRPLSDEATAGLLRVMKAKELRRGQVWLQEGAVCDKMTFVVKGLMKLYFEVGSKEVVLEVAKSNEWIFASHSYLLKCPSSHIIRSVERSAIVYLSHIEINELVEKLPELNFHFRTVLQRKMAEFEYHVGLLLLPPRERFNKLLIDNKWIVDGKSITDRLLAGYLGIGANVLSAYKSKIA